MAMYANYRGMVDKFPKDTSGYKKDDCILYKNDIYIFDGNQFNITLTEEEKAKGIIVINNRKYQGLLLDDITDGLVNEQSLCQIIESYQYNNNWTNEKLFETLKAYMEHNFDCIIKKNAELLEELYSSLYNSLGVEPGLLSKTPIGNKLNKKYHHDDIDAKIYA